MAPIPARSYAVPMKKWWLIGGAVVLVLAGLLAGPWIYGKFIAEDDAPAASVSTEGAQAASGSVDGQWAVGPGEGANRPPPGTRCPKFSTVPGSPSSAPPTRSTATSPSPVRR